MVRPKGTGGKALGMNDETFREVTLELAKGANGLRNSTIWLLGWATSCRVSEVLTLRVRDVWASRASCGGTPTPLSRLFLDASRTKTHTSSTIILSRFARRTITRWMLFRGPDAAPSEFLFPGRFPGKPLSYKRFEAELVAVRERLGLPLLRSHSMRRGGAQLGKELTGDLGLVQEQLRHQRLNTTQEYVRNSEVAMEKHMDTIGDHIDEALGDSLESSLLNLVG